MHLFNMATIFVVLCLVGVEFSVSAFINPAVWRLDPEAQLKFLSRSALVLGKVMPVWYPLSFLMLAVETWLYWHTGGRALLLASASIWLLTSLASILILVPLNTRIVRGDADWQRIHRTWDSGHRVRIGAIAIAAALVTSVVVR